MIDRRRGIQALFATHRSGVSLTEILIVMVIMAIIAGISLAAFLGAFTRGREANTRAMISKVDRALQDHLNQWITRTQPSGPNVQVLATDLVVAANDNERAQVIARKRLYKEEFPQFFLVLDATTDLQNPVFIGDWDPVDWDAMGLGATDQQFEELSGAAREYRSMVLEAHREEVNATPPRPGLANHDPTTASAECLYMILLRAARSGSSEVDPESFPHREIEDTDGDGLPELVDGWGIPLRFYRSPIFYDSDGVQKGTLPYFDDVVQPAPPLVRELREEDELDPNRTLMLDGWWNSALAGDFQTAISNRGGGVSPAPLAFHVLVDALMNPLPPQANPDVPVIRPWNQDPNADVPNPNYGFNAGSYARAYKAHPLIVSAGVDEQFGIYPPSNWMSDPSLNFLTTSGDRQLAAGAPKITQRFLSLPFFTGRIPAGAGQEVQLELDKHLDNITNHELRAD